MSHGFKSLFLFLINLWIIKHLVLSELQCRFFCFWMVRFYLIQNLNGINFKFLLFYANAFVTGTPVYYGRLQPFLYQLMVLLKFSAC